MPFKNPKTVNMNFKNSKLLLCISLVLIFSSKHIYAQTATGNNVFPATTATTPAYIFSSNITTPIYRLYVGGATKIFGTGGSGLSSASLYLVNTSATTGRRLFLNSDNSGSLRFMDSLYTIPRFIIDSSGKIGINNATPTERLDVTGNIRFSGALMPNNAAGAAGQFLTSAGAGLPPTWTAATSYFNTNLGTGYRWAVPGSNNIKTLFNGYAIAIDSTTNTNGLTVKVDSAILSGKYLKITDTANKWQPKGTYLTANQAITVTGDATGSGTTAIPLTLNTVNSNIGTFNNLTVNAKGLVTAASNVTYLTSASLGNTAWLLAGNTTNAATDFLGTTNNTSLRIRTNNTLKMIVDSVGNVGIGTPAPAYKLDINGNARISTLNFLASRDTILTYDPITKEIKVTKLPAGSGGGSPVGNNGNIQIKSGSLFNTPALDSLHFVTGQGLSVKGTIRGNNGGNDIILEDGSGRRAFRSVNAVGWADNPATQFFQIGDINDKVAFTAKTGSNMARALFSADKLQLSSGTYTLTPAPTDNFEIINTTNAKIFGVDATGGIKFFGALMPGGQSGTAGYLLTSGGTGTPVWTAPGSVVAANAWGLKGNAGTNPDSNFIGTTDDKDLVFKRGGVVSGLINSALGNSSFGLSALKNNTTGYSNTAIGNYAGLANTTGNYNSFIGTQAGVSNTTGIQNTFIGANAGLANTTGQFNNFIGTGAGGANTTGSLNSFVGAYAGASNQSGGNNSFFGYNTGSATTSGNYNTFLGMQAGLSNKTGDNNNFIGFQAGGYNDGGGGNNYIGRYAGWQNMAGNNNTAVGGSALADALSSNNTAVGSNTGGGITTGGNNTIIGANVTGLSSTLSNNIILADGQGNRRINVDANGNTGIGTITPTEKLDVAGNFKLSGALMPNNAAGTTGQVLTSAGPGAPPTWQPAASAGVTTASNGLTAIGNNVKLGGTLTNNTTISNLDSSLTFSFNNGSYKKIGAIGNYIGEIEKYSNGRYHVFSEKSSSVNDYWNWNWTIDSVAKSSTREALEPTWGFKWDVQRFSEFNGYNPRPILVRHAGDRYGRMGFRNNGYGGGMYIDTFRLDGTEDLLYDFGLDGNIKIYASPLTGTSTDSALVWDASSKIIKKIAQSSLGATVTASNGLTASSSNVKLGGDLLNDTKIDVKNNWLWLKTPFKANEDTNKVGQVIIGDTTNVQKWSYSGGSNTLYDGQKNSALVISKTKYNNNENVDFLTLTTADAPSKNGWVFQNYTNVAGYARPRLITYSLDGAGYEHYLFTKASITETAFLLNIANYDSLNLAGNPYKPINDNANLFAINNGNVNKFLIKGNGNVGIGTTNTSDTAYKLFVEKGIRTRKVKVDITAWPDYVFKPTYKLPSLNELEKYLLSNQHLPEVPAAEEVEKNGIDLGSNQAILLKKVEELTLYMIDLNKKVEALAKENEELKKKVTVTSNK
jgi:trimeric autotransporter adhesin